MIKNLIPTKIFKGENIILNNQDEIIIGKKAMIITGKTSGEKSGALDDVKKILDAKGIPYLVYNKISNNPTIEETVEAGEEARRYNCDFLIGIGGGSPLDATKAIAVYAKNPPKENSSFDVYDIFLNNFENEPLPMIAIPTTAGTGSEATQYSILTLHKEKNKKSFASDRVFYKKAFIDGRYTLNLPLQIARNTFVDTLCHLIEGYTNKRASKKTDSYALAGLEILSSHKDRFLNGKFDIPSCTELLYASTIGGAVIAHTGTTIIHSMGYPLTYYKNIPHGQANGIILREYLRRTKEVSKDKLENILKALNFNSQEEFEEYIGKIIEIPDNITFDEISEWTKTTIQSKNALVCPFDVSYEKEVEIFKKCLKI